MGNLHGKLRLIGHIKMDCENIFYTKKKDTCLLPFQSIIQSLPYLSFSLTVIELHRGVEWVGSFLKNFQKGKGGYGMLSLQQLNYTLIPFPLNIFSPNNNAKFKDYKDFKNLNPLSLKISRKTSALLNSRYTFQLLPTYSFPSQEFKYFS